MSQKKRNKYFLKEKALIRLKAEQNKLWEAKHNENLIELEKPIHDGYYAEYVLRDDILNRSDADVFQEALDICKSKVWCRNSNFITRDWRTRRMVKVDPVLHKINKEKYDSLSPSAKKLFVETLPPKRLWGFSINDKFYACTLTYQVVIKVTKAYITHRRERDGVLYSMIDEIESNMYNITPYPWGKYRDFSGKFWRKHENKKEKFKAQREIVDKIKTYKTTHDTDLD